MDEVDVEILHGVGWEMSFVVSGYTRVDDDSFRRWIDVCDSAAFNGDTDAGTTCGFDPEGT